MAGYLVVEFVSTRIISGISCAQISPAIRQRGESGNPGVNKMDWGFLITPIEPHKDAFDRKGINIPYIPLDNIDDGLVFFQGDEKSAARKPHSTDAW